MAEMSQTWNFAAIGRLTLVIFQLLFNTSMLSVFIFHPSLRTSFTVYIMALLSCNIFYSAGEYPLEILRLTYPQWWMSERACGFYLYHIWVFCAVSMHMHVLITINRLWALFYPVSYRQRHSSKVAVLMCLGMVGYVHVICFPVYIIDQLYYRRPADQFGCVLNIKEQNVYGTVANIMVGMGSTMHLRGSTMNFRGDFSLTSHGHKSGHSPSHKSNRKPNHGDHLRPFLVLTLLTVSVLVCWTPDQTYWTIACFMQMMDLPVLRNFTMVLFALQAVLDPILFAMSLASFRNYLWQICRSCCCCLAGAGHKK
ncbi:uncharacterized protein LOC129596492 [Paramacrobiotus metropolitanus]|uniref:uncharacterized protein LOC129596492 n=1 Tax=Paramacrobiotus metropolitanus TaxID=2943436 RepID=UPI0024458D78|nr:uncharacterized protein LOC129596492 [Paramacrobiotus metropolitanus]